MRHCSEVGGGCRSSVGSGRCSVCSCIALMCQVVYGCWF